MANNNQPTPVLEELGGPAEGNTPQLTELGSQVLNGPELNRNQTSSNTLQEDQFRPKRDRLLGPIISPSALFEDFFSGFPQLLG